MLAKVACTCLDYSWVPFSRWFLIALLFCRA
uniref:Uncharacterized protein n=2 Tax=Anguilla anguilla TaxID=7936 RepID=A0A0E9UIM0_ANGAN